MHMYLTVVSILVMCNIYDTSILIVDTYVMIPVLPRSRYSISDILWYIVAVRSTFVSIDDTIQLIPLAKSARFSLQCQNELKSQ